MKPFWHFILDEKIKARVPMFLQVFLTCCAILHTYTYSILGPRLWSLKLEAFTNLHVLFRKRRSDTPGMQTQILRMEVNEFLKRLQ